MPPVRGADAVCAQYDMPAGVAFSFQVALYSVEPTVANRCFNLLTKDDWRAADLDKVKEDGPEVALVCEAEFLSGGGECLTGTRPIPKWRVAGDSGELEGERPSADAGEEVTLGVACEVPGIDIFDGSFIDFSFGQQPSFDQFPQPRCGLRVEFVVVVHASAR